MAKITLISLPYDSGRWNERMGRGATDLIESGLAEHLRSQQHDVEVHTVRLSEKLHSEGQALVALQNLAVPIVREALAGGRRVLILSGNCGPAALSAVSALNPGTTGAAWFDAHADFNTPETSASGFLDGMSLAILTGRCWPALAARFADFLPVPDANIVLVAARDLDLPEATALSQSVITTVAPRKMEAFGRAVEALSERVENIYVHLDVDVLDDSEGHANSYASGGGLSAQALYSALETLERTGRIRVGSITSYEPACDHRGSIRAIIQNAATILAGGGLPSPRSLTKIMGGRNSTP
ncbi:MAG: arginase family protein [Verrucomicrobiota bacterium]|nr:arginase family protein [Verrucomicrobiota bacterium]